MKRLNLVLLFAIFLCLGCKKDFLDKKPSKSIITLQTLDDFWALLDNNRTVMNINPGLVLIASDDIYVPSNAVGAMRPIERNSYLWAGDIFEGAYANDWIYGYTQIFYSNVILDELKKIGDTSHPEWSVIKGAAFFYRAYAFFNMAQTFCKQFNGATAENDLGIPIRLESDVNINSKRASLMETYVQIIKDLEEALNTLPELPKYKTRPSKAAAYALLARVYLSMEDYNNSNLFSSKSLELQSTLMDYNLIDSTLALPFGVLNEEVIHDATLSYYSIFSSSSFIIDSLLYQSYDHNDLRKVLFYNDRGNGIINFKGSYQNHISNLFGGLAVDEMILIKAESLCRLGECQLGMQVLYELLKKRYKSITTDWLFFENKDEALRRILEERRKQLAFRGLRWFDLKRINRDNNLAKTLNRHWNGNIYTLLPNSPNYVFPIPDNEIALSGIDQNIREN